MKVLVIGGGGREHALVWKISQSNLVDEIFSIPGNAGISKIARCADISLGDIEGLVSFAKEKKIDFTIVGPEAPLVSGIVDAFLADKLKIFGPTKDAAQLEGSKAFCKNFLRKYGIPTPNFRVFTQSKSALSFVKLASFPIVVKADGLAGGKGTVICNSLSEAIVSIEGMMEKGIFGKAGEKIVIEEFLEGIEASVISIVDGKNILTLENVQDYKKAFDGDRGPNTGGMGAYSPVPAISSKDYDRVIREIVVPTVHGLKKEGIRFRGVLYAGVMFTRTGPKVLEFNVRFGDPETQPTMLRLKSDLVKILVSAYEGKLDDVEIEWDARPAVCVVLASKGYPGKYETGFEISGLDKVEGQEDVVVFHAGTAIKNGKIVTAGGRVLGVTALGDTIKSAKQRAYEAVSQINFEGSFYRKDIGDRAIAV